jgi:hypothetical protein
MESRQTTLLPRVTPVVYAGARETSARDELQSSAPAPNSPLLSAGIRASRSQRTRRRQWRNTDLARTPTTLTEPRHEQERDAPLRPIAVLRLEPGDFSKNYGISFAPDDRDTVAALVQTAGRQYMLLHHLHAPVAGTEVLASERSSHPRQDLRELLDALDLRDDVVEWALDDSAAE